MTSLQIVQILVGLVLMVVLIIMGVAWTTLVWMFAGAVVIGAVFALLAVGLDRLAEALGYKLPR